MTLSATHPFDTLALDDLATRPSAKWKYFDPGVLPLWVAEMDYPLAPSIKRAIHDQVETNDLGYQMQAGLPGLREAVARRMTDRYGLAVEAEGVVPLGTTGTGLLLSVLAFSEPGDEVLLLTPLYPPFMRAVESTGRVPVNVQLLNDGKGYGLDLAALESAVTPKTRLLMLCSPHNPIGRAFTVDELEAMADLAERHDLTIVSDELHADLTLEGRHVPIASLNEKAAARTVTLYGPTKAFNIPGMKISFAIGNDAELLERLSEVGGGLPTPPNVLAQAATIGAYTGGDAWLEDVLGYLRGNRDHLLARVAREMPAVKVYPPAATYLAWLDLRAFDLGERPAEVLAERAKVGLSEGADFGPGGEGFVRLNFATSRPILDEALDRLARVLG